VCMYSNEFTLVFLHYLGKVIQRLNQGRLKDFMFSFSFDT